MKLYYLTTRIHFLFNTIDTVVNITIILYNIIYDIILYHINAAKIYFGKNMMYTLKLNL